MLLEKEEFKTPQVRRRGHLTVEERKQLNYLKRKEKVAPLDKAERYELVELEYKAGLYEAKENKKCVICGDDIQGYGNNAAPVADGICCDKCNTSKVIPARLSKINKKEEALTEEQDEYKVTVYDVKEGSRGPIGRKRKVYVKSFPNKEEAYKIAKLELDKVSHTGLGYSYAEIELPDGDIDVLSESLTEGKNLDDIVYDALSRITLKGNDGKPRHPEVYANPKGNGYRLEIEDDESGIDQVASIAKKYKLNYNIKHMRDYTEITVDLPERKLFEKSYKRLPTYGNDDADPHYVVGDMEMFEPPYFDSKEEAIREGIKRLNYYKKNSIDDELFVLYSVWKEYGEEDWEQLGTYNINGVEVPYDEDMYDEEGILVPLQSKQKEKDWKDKISNSKELKDLQKKLDYKLFTFTDDGVLFGFWDPISNEIKDYLNSNFKVKYGEYDNLYHYYTVTLLKDNFIKSNDNIQESFEIKESYTDPVLYKVSIEAAQSMVDTAIEKFGRVGAGLMDDLDELGFYIDSENKVKQKVSTDDEVIKESFEDEHLGTSTEETPEPGPEAGIASLVNKLIIDEWEAIQGYNDAIVAAETEGYSDIANVLRDIANEENLHVGQLEQVMQQLSPNAESINQGEVEADEQLNTTKETSEDPEEGMHY